jgi:hypothetical protein
MQAILLSILGLIGLFLGSCSTPEAPINYIATISNLKGEIHTNKDQYVLGEPIQITVYLENISDTEYQTEIAYHREDPEAPIQSISFNAVHESDKSLHLQLTQAPTPFQGKFQLASGAKLEFMKMEFQAEQGGEYLIECSIEWKVNRKVNIPLKHIRIYSPQLEVIRYEKEIPPALAKQITQQIYNLKSNDIQERERSIKALMEGGGPAKYFLVHYSGSEDPQLAQLCLFLLIEMKENAQKALLIGMYSENEQIRWNCCFALEKLQNPEIIPDIIRFLEAESSSRIRIRMVSLYISLIEEPLAQWALIQSLKNEDRVIQKMASKRLLSKQKDLPFESNAPFKVRQQQIEQWEQWWKSTYPEVTLPQSAPQSE